MNRRIPRALRGLGRIEEAHTAQPQDHYYLAVLGTRTRPPGQGLGSALLAPVLDRCDGEGIGAYLESSKEANIPFYRRHGFEVVEEVPFAGGPKLWPCGATPNPHERLLVEVRRPRRRPDRRTAHARRGATDGRRGSMLVAAGILLSRIAGLLREVAISGYLGVGATADVFKAAARIPNLLQNLLGEGVLSASFIPVYSRALERDEAEGATPRRQGPRPAPRGDEPPSSCSGCCSPDR